MEDEADIAEGDILKLSLARQQSYQGSCELLDGRSLHIAFGQHVHRLKHDLDSGKDDGGVVMGQTRKHSLNDVLRLSHLANFVDGNGLENIDLAPLVAISYSCEHLVKVLALLEGEVVLVGRFRDLKNSGTGISHNDCVTIEQQALKSLDELVVLDKARRRLIKLRYGCSCRLLDIGIVIGE